MAAPTIKINSDECVYVEIGDWTINIDISIPNDGVMVMYWETNEDGPTIFALPHPSTCRYNKRRYPTGVKHDD